MSQDLLAKLPDRLESLATLLSEGLLHLHGEDAAPALIQAAVVPATLPAYLAKLNAPPDMALDQYLTHSLYNDGLLLIGLACLRASGELRWEALDDLLPLVKRFASYYSTQSPRYAGFRAITRDRLGDFWNGYCADGEWFGLLAEATRWQSVRLCAYHDGRNNTTEATTGLLQGILGPVWALASQRVGMKEADALAIWNAVEASAERYRRRWQVRA